MDNAVDLSPPRARWKVGRPILEVTLIALGVFLGLAGEQWRVNIERRAQARAALERFRAEILANQKAVSDVRDYHIDLNSRLIEYFKLDAAARKAANVRMTGIRAVTFEHTALDLAIATQSFTDIDRDLAFAITRAYGLQGMYQELSRGIFQAMYLRPLTENLDGFLSSLRVFLGDVVMIEPKLLELYAELLIDLDRELAR
jgi:hypothetical protein